MVVEIRFDLELCPSSAAWVAVFEGLVDAMEMLPWTLGCAITYGRLRAALERSGTPLAAMDLLIASHALSEGCTLISADQALGQVPGLSVEVW